MALCKWTGPQRFYDKPRQVLRQGRELSTRAVVRGDLLELDPETAEAEGAEILPDPETPEDVVEGAEGGDGEEGEGGTPEGGENADDASEEGVIPLHGSDDEKPKEEGDDQPKEGDEEEPEEWTLSVTPENYLKTHPTGPNAALARRLTAGGGEEG